jgi:cobalt/nickel transport system permease protein
MHIPDGFLDPKMSAGLLGAAAFALTYCLSKVKAAVTALAPQAALAAAGRGMSNVVGGMRRVLTGDGIRTIQQMALVASLIFTAQLFDFPVGQGTSGHLIGSLLAAVLLGPWAGTIVMAVVLAVQMFFMADGGLLALGANIVNMAVIGSFVSYYIYYWSQKIAPEWLAIAVAAWSAVVLAAAACALEVGFSGKVDLALIVPAMLRTHAIVGVAEALMTIAAVKAWRNFFPDNS